MKSMFSLSLCMMCLVFSTSAQDIFVFKNGSVRTGYSYFQDLPDAVQVADGSGRTFPISKSSLSYIQRVTGQQLVFDNGKHPFLTLIDLQVQASLQNQHSGAVNAAMIDNITPGKKATVTGAQVTFYRDKYLMSKVQVYLVAGEDVVTIEQVAAPETSGFTGSYLVSFISKSGIVFKGWVRKTNLIVEAK